MEPVMTGLPPPAAFSFPLLVVNSILYFDSSRRPLIGRIFNPIGCGLRQGLQRFISIFIQTLAQRAWGVSRLI
jgi:hypothetical protein